MTKPSSIRGIRRNAVLLAWLAVLVVAQGALGQSVDQVHVGRVAARGAVLRTSPNAGDNVSVDGRPTWVEYDIFGDIRRYVTQEDGLSALSPGEVNAVVARWRQARDEYVADEGVPPRTLSRDAYAGLRCVDIEGTERDVEPLSEGLRWALVPHEDPARLPVCEGLPLYATFLADPELALSGDVSSILMRDGEVVETATDDGVFAFESSFFTPASDAPTTCSPETWSGFVDPNATAFTYCAPHNHGHVWAPVVGVRFDPINVPVNRGGYFPPGAAALRWVGAMSNDAGYYRIPFSVPTLDEANDAWFTFAAVAANLPYVDPRQDFFYNITGEVRFENFNPRDNSSKFFFVRSPIQFSGRRNPHSNIALDVALGHFIVRMTNTPSGPPEAWLPLVDPACDGSEFTQFALTDEGEGGPQNQGLVEQISCPDLRDTDVYIFREADGSLIGARWGMKYQEVAGFDLDPRIVPNARTPAECLGNACIQFGIVTRGPASRRQSGGATLLLPAATVSAEEDPFDRELTGIETRYLSPIAPYTNFLRSGDRVRVVVVNRATGYIGTLRTQVAQAPNGLARIGQNGEEIILRPPNLRVQAYRHIDREASPGFDGETDRNIISFQGQGLQSDDLIQIVTEWLDVDGSPLPETLPGYTGRLARVVMSGELVPEGSTDADADTVGQFSIAPGRHVQVIRTPRSDGATGRAHFYVHVDGAPKERLIDFSGGVGPAGPDFSVSEVCYRTGDADAPYTCIPKTAGDGLEQRPADFVPFMVDHFDADATRALAEVRAAALADAYAEGEPVPVLEDLDPVYRAVYSPEYRFTMRDLEVDRVDVVTTVDDEGRSRTTATVGYDNREPGDDPLDPTTSDDGLAVHAGYETMSAMAGESGETEFPDIDDFLAMTPARQAEELGEMVGSLTLEDFLTLGIYDLDDPANPLWELDGLPLVLADAQRLAFERRHITAQHGTSTTASPDYIDDYQFFRFLLFRPSNVVLRVEDGNGNGLGTLSTRRGVPPGMWNFVVDAGDLIDLGVDPAGTDDGDAGSSDGRFVLVLEVDRDDETIEEHTHEVRWPGRLTEQQPNLVLGQTATNDVLLRDGSLRLSRQDLLVQGRGPAIQLSRNYSNLTTSRDSSPFGPGWTNDHDMQLVPLTEGDSSGMPGSIPGWVSDLKSEGGQTRLLRESEIVVPEPGEMRWTGVAVNGTVFRRDPGGAWQVERGRHGQLQEVAGEFVFTALDGTRYVYPIPQLQPPVPDTPSAGPGDDVTRTHMSIGDGLVYRLGITAESLRIAPDPDTPWERPIQPPRPGAPQPTKVARIVDRNDQALTFFYDTQGRLSALEDSVQRRLELTYVDLPTPEGPQARIQRATLHDRAGVTLRTVNYRYDALGYLEEVDRHGRVERYRYRDECAAIGDDTPGGAERNLVEVHKTPDGSEWLVMRYAYFGQGELPASVAAFAGNVRDCDVVREVGYPVRDDERDPLSPGDPTVRYTYDGLRRTVTNPRGEATTYTLNEFGNTTLIEGPLGQRTEQHWSIDEASPSDNVLVRKVETLGGARTRTWRYEYTRDELGRLQQVVEFDPYNNASTTDYDPRFAVPVRREDRNGNVEVWTYDSRGNLETHTAGEGAEAATWTFTYDANFQRRTARAPGRTGVTVTTYDSYGNVDEITEPSDGAPVVTNLDHDPLGRLVARTDPGGFVTTYQYDDHDNLTRAVHPSVELPSDADPAAVAALHSSEVESFTYDLLGNRLTETDRRGLTVSYTYTAQDQVKTIRRSAGAVPDAERRFRYDNIGNLVSETDWKGAATVHEYDALDRRVATVNRVGDRMEQDYDLADNVTEIRSYAGRVTTFTYDLLDRLETQQRAGDEGRWVEFQYDRDEHDADTNLTRVTEHRGAGHAPLVTTYTYDSHDRPRTRTVETAGGESHTYEWRYSLDSTLEREIDEEGRETTYEYDNLGRRTAACREHTPEGGSASPVCTRYERDARGQVIAVRDALDRVTRVDFDAWGRAWRLTDPDGHTVTRLFDGEGALVDARDPEGNHQLTFRDQLGRVERVTDRTGRDVQHVREFDANGNPTLIENGRGYQTQIVYDAEEREVTITEGLTAGGADDSVPPRSWSILERDGSGNPLRMQDALERVTRIAYNDNELPSTITDPLGQISRRTYTRTGQVHTETDRRDTTTTYAYDGRDRLQRVTDVNDDYLEYRYDRVGNVRFVRDRRGIETETRYDDLDRPIHVFHGGERVQSMTYDAAGQLTSVRNGRDHITRYENYDARGNARTIRHPDDTTTTFTFDSLGRVETTTNEEDETTNFTYDEEGRIASVTFAGEVASFRYDVHGNLLELTKPESQPGRRNAGQTRVLHYDRFDRLSRVVEGGLQTTYEYDAADNLRHQRDPLDRHVEYTYDALDRRVAHVQHRPASEGPALTSTVTEYDPEGAPLRIQNPLGEETRFVYDALGRPEDVFFPLRATPTASVLRQAHYEYDANGNLEQLTETRERPDGSTYPEIIDPSYDARDRLSGVTTRGVAVTYAYDVDGNRTAVTSPAGNTTYEYDNRDRLLAAITPEGRTEYGYFDDGAMEEVIRPNGTQTLYTWSAANRVESIIHRRSPTQDDPAVDFARYDYTWDRNGNRLTERAEIAGAVEDTTYEYDSVDRLSAFTRTPAGGTAERTAYTFAGYDRATETLTRDATTLRTRTYSYDGVGRVTQVEENEPAGAGLHTLAYTVDASGNTLRQTDSADASATVEYEYDALDQLTRAVRDPSGTAEVLGRYEYDSTGRRIRALGTDRGDVEYHYDGGAVLEEHDAGTGTLLAHYRYADRLLNLSAGADVQWYHQDGAGSTGVLTTGDGDIAASYRNDPFGAIRQETGSTVNRRVFTGHEHDDETGLVYMGSRYYDPALGRFLTQDTYLGRPGEPPSLNRYTYAHGNPGAMWDPDGRAAIRIGQHPGEREAAVPVPVSTQSAPADQRRPGPSAEQQAALFQIQQQAASAEASIGNFWVTQGRHAAFNLAFAPARGLSNGLSMMFGGGEDGDGSPGVKRGLGNPENGVRASRGDMMRLRGSGDSSYDQLLHDVNGAASTLETGFTVAGMALGLAITMVVPTTMMDAGLSLLPVVGWLARAARIGRAASRLGALSRTALRVSAAATGRLGRAATRVTSEAASGALRMTQRATSAARSGAAAAGRAVRRVGDTMRAATSAGRRALGRAGGTLQRSADEFAGPAGLCRRVLCFGEGTLVRTPEGHVAIEEVQVGDLVLAQSDEGETAYRRVQATWQRVLPVSELTVVDDEGVELTLRVTAEHPFFVEGTGWTDLHDLRVGDELRGTGGEHLRVVGLASTNDVDVVHNLTVEGFHTYFVFGAEGAGLLSHNCGDLDAAARARRTHPWRGSSHTVPQTLSLGELRILRRRHRMRRIADNPVLLDLWERAVAAKAAGTGVAGRFLRGTSRPGDDLSDVFSAVVEKFKQLAANEGVRLPRANGQFWPIHHWNFTKYHFPEQVLDPGHLFLTHPRFHNATGTGIHQLVQIPGRHATRGQVPRRFEMGPILRGLRPPGG